MELSTIEMPREQAREAFKDYRAAVRARHDEEDQSLMRGYRELATGRHLIRLSDTIRAGGFEQLEFRRSTARRGPRVMVTGQLPRLAVARADARLCFTDGVQQDGSVHFRGKGEIHARNRADRIDLPQVFEADEHLVGLADTWVTTWRTPRFRAIVPNVPPPLRPSDALGNYHLLFEAEWALAAPAAPVDPALIKHIGGDIWAVHAVWDLTELERAVLSGRGA